MRMLLLAAYVAGICTTVNAAGGRGQLRDESAVQRDPDFQPFARRDAECFSRKAVRIRLGVSRVLPNLRRVMPRPQERQRQVQFAWPFGRQTSQVPCLSPAPCSDEDFADFADEDPSFIPPSRDQFQEVEAG